VISGVIPFSDLSTSDLVIDALYEGGTLGDVRDDPLDPLLRVGLQGGFRAANFGASSPRYAVLYSSGVNRDWPDYFDIATGLFTYYGDNKRPGHELHATARGGNRLLRTVFECIHASPPAREDVPPFFIFTRAAGTVGRVVQFRGLAVPGAPAVPPTEDLVAVWKSTMGSRFQNYRALFTVLNAPVVSRAWILDLQNGQALSEHCPTAWRTWVTTGAYNLLRAEPTIQYRTVEQQLPTNESLRAMLNAIYQYFREDPIGFERCAASIAELMDRRVVIDEITRPTADGGRDAVGRYHLGPASDPISIDFALEAKCYSPGLSGMPINTVGVREVSRLISRLRFRQFGILVTTSAVARQAYDEIRQDGHPVIVMCGRDITELLVEKGMSTVAAVEAWLLREFPTASTVS
jgi:Restriction endonuclease AspBHI N-terminal/Restriction endonuclease